MPAIGWQYLHKHDITVDNCIHCAATVVIDRKSEAKEALMLLELLILAAIVASVGFTLVPIRRVGLSVSCASASPGRTEPVCEPATLIEPSTGLSVDVAQLSGVLLDPPITGTGIVFERMLHAANGVDWADLAREVVGS